MEKKKSKTEQLALTRRSWTKTREDVAALLYSISGRPLVCHTDLDAGLFLANFKFFSERVLLSLFCFQSQSILIAKCNKRFLKIPCRALPTANNGDYGVNCVEIIVFFKYTPPTHCL